MNVGRRQWRISTKLMYLKNYMNEEWDNVTMSFLLSHYSKRYLPFKDRPKPQE